MPFPTLLTFYAHENDTPALAAGLALAANSGAHLDVLHVLRDVTKDTQAFALGASARQLETLVEKEEESQIAEAGMLFSEFTRMAADQRVTTMGGAAAVDFPSNDGSARWLLAQAEPEEELILQSHVHDLTLLAWHKEYREIELEKVLAASARPVMLIPAGYRASKFTRASILWNNSGGVTHAIALSLPLLKSMEKVQIITATANGAEPPVPGLTLTDYLAAHGVAATTVELATSGNPAEALYTACEKFGSDVIIMGAFSKKSLREKLLGSVTRALLEKTTIPLLMAY